MMNIEEHLRLLARIITRAGGNIIGYDWVSRWPKGRLKELVELGVVIEAQPGTEIVCHECDEDCSLEPPIRTYPDGRTIGFFICAHGGKVEVPMEHFKRWEVLSDKLHELGYVQPISDEEVTNEQAAVILGGGISAATISKWVKSGLISDNHRSGRQHRVLKSSILLFKYQRDQEKQLERAKDMINLEAAMKK
ncbi:MAG: hypothetical protein A2Y10_08715 [Planctomycetes bacterium GWF2_41_51]|nr:MAG: hypothetical protein A2Y10_08715 [Planctomycetes bacterium GWF2_41_51]HBG28363.1 hypothetical protein [Phycisphaerales bacterium]